MEVTRTLEQSNDQTCYTFVGTLKYIILRKGRKQMLYMCVYIKKKSTTCEIHSLRQMWNTKINTLSTSFNKYHKNDLFFFFFLNIKHDVMFFWASQAKRTALTEHLCALPLFHLHVEALGKNMIVLYEVVFMYISDACSVFVFW